MKREQIWGELTGDGKNYKVKLELTVNELRVDESPMPVGRAIARMALSPTSGVAVEDGRYTLRYAFDGQAKADAVRVESGTLLAG